MWRLVEIKLGCICLNVTRQQVLYTIIKNGRDNGDKKFLGWFYHPCQAKHESSSNKDDFYDGFVDYNYNGREDRGESVIVWRGPKHNNGHATTKLNMKEWETAKS